MHQTILVASCALALLCASVLQAQEAPQARAEAAARAKALFENEREFEKLSGTKRTLLELQFGRKRPVAVPQVLPRGRAMQVTQPNPLVNNPAEDKTAQDTQSETTLLSFGNSIVVAFNDSGSYDGAFDMYDHFTGFSISIDGGRSFTDRGILPKSPAGDGGDPVLARDESNGLIYLTTLGLNDGSVIQVFRSTDGGNTFQAPVNGVPGRQDLDKQWIAVDNFSGPGRGNAYLVARDFGAGNGIYLTRSTDGGSTWGPNGGIEIVDAGAFNVQGAFVVVAPDHAVYAFWLDQTAGALTPNIIKVRKSTDLGGSFGPAVTVATLTTTASNGDLGLLPGFRTNAFPQAAVNPVSGQLYVVFNDTGKGADKGDVFLVQSADGGASWSQPVRVNDDSTMNDQFQPAIAVAADGASLCVAWYDRRTDAANDLISMYAATAGITGGTVTFARNVAVSDQSFPAVFGVDPAVNSTYMGDYNQVVASGNCFAVTWGDNRDLSIAVPARRQADVRFASVCALTGPCQILRGCGLEMHLAGDNGTVAFSPCGAASTRLSALAIDKEDASYWYYRGTASPGDRWAVGKKHFSWDAVPVWTFDTTLGKWHFVAWSRRACCVECVGLKTN